MQEPRGRWLTLSPQRTIICDLMHFSKQIPSIPVQRRMRLGAAVEARRRAETRPGWVPIFAKAFAQVAAEMPELRRSYLSLPGHGFTSTRSASPRSPSKRASTASRPCSS